MNIQPMKYPARGNASAVSGVISASSVHVNPARERRTVPGRRRGRISSYSLVYTFDLTNPKVLALYINNPTRTRPNNSFSKLHP